MNNALLGMTIQKYICEKYNISMNKKAESQFQSNYNKKYEIGLNDLTNSIFKDIGSIPVKCLTFSNSINNKETLSPHNFMLKNGNTVSIRTNKNGDKASPRVVGQCGLKVFNDFFSEIAGFEIRDKEEIKEVVFNNIHKMIPIFLDYLFQIIQFGYDMITLDIIMKFSIAIRL